MFFQVASTTLRLLLFRAGPQDFPYSPALAPWLPAAGAASYFVLFRVVLPFAPALLLALLAVGALALMTHAVLNVRRLLNRFQQTYHALLATGTVLALASLPAIVALAPALKQIAQHPELLEQPDGVPVPPLASFTVNTLNLWNLAVYAHIFRHALDARLWAGVLVALLVVFGVLFLTVLFGQLLLPLLGLAPHAVP